MSFFRRRIRLTSTPGRVAAGLEDDFHHFRVTIDHDGARVTAVAGEGVRYPWSTCPLAAAELEGLVGAPLARRSTDIADLLRPRDNCTHMFDLAGLALVQAGTGRPDRQYDIEVPDRVGGVTTPRLACNGVPFLEWTVRDGVIEDPPPYAGQALQGGFMAWATSALDPDAAEAAIVLRRATDIAHGRTFDLDGTAVAADVGPFMAGRCFTFQKGRMEQARRITGAGRDFADRPDALLQEEPA